MAKTFSCWGLGILDMNEIHIVRRVWGLYGCIVNITAIHFLCSPRWVLTWGNFAIYNITSQNGPMVPYIHFEYIFWDQKNRQSQNGPKK